MKPRPHQLSGATFKPPDMPDRFAKDYKLPFDVPAATIGCEGCEDVDVNMTFSGVRWPTAANCDTTRSWIERCDACQRFNSDLDAATFLAVAILGHTVRRATQVIGVGYPAGSRSPVPFLRGGGLPR